MSTLQRAVTLVDLIHGWTGDEDALAVAIAAVLESFGEHDVVIDPEELADLVDVCRRLRAVLVSIDRDEAATRLNRLLADHPARPRLVRHEGWDWHLHVDSVDDAPWAEWLASSASLELAGVLVAAEGVPWGECAAAGCERVFVHDGRGGDRKYCSTTCATRERVRRHRAISRRRRPGGPAPAGATAKA
jgi:predicted RNA-binding Zn ribbon-like protein